MQELKKRTFEKNGLTYTVKHVLDENPDLSYLQQDYSDCPPKEAAKYREQDRKRLAEWERGKWYLLGVIVEISKRTSRNWAVPTVVGRASVWEVESDCSESDFAEIEADMIAEAEDDLAILREALK